MNEAGELGQSREKRPGLQEPWLVRLFVANDTASGLAAIHNLKALQAEFFPIGSRVEIIDCRQNPEKCRADQVVATPTLIRVEPKPIRRIIGNLNDRLRTLKLLGLA